MLSSASMWSRGQRDGAALLVAAYQSRPVGLESWSSPFAPSAQWVEQSRWHA